MKKYTGTKTIKARPMNLGDYNRYRDWEIPKSENPKREGYLVGYPDAAGDFSGPWEDGCNHISWSPKEIFEAAYTEGCCSLETREELENELIKAEIELKRAQTKLMCLQTVVEYDEINH